MFQKRCVKSMVILILIQFLSYACFSSSESIERKFELVTLLINENSMPSGWIVEYPPDNYSEPYTVDAVKTGFIYSQKDYRIPSFQYIEQYRTESEASKVIKRDYIPTVQGRDEFVPEEWNLPNTSADEETFKCKYDILSKDVERSLFCSWVARYQEYLVTFGVWEMPETMTFSEFEAIIIQIDQKIVDVMYSSDE